MADNVLKKYEIQITANTEELEKSLKQAQQTIDDFGKGKGLDKTILGQFAQVQESISAVSQQVSKLKGTITTSGLSGFSEDVKQSYNKLASSITENVTGINEKLDTLRTSTESLANMKFSDGLNTQFKELSENIKNVLTQYTEFSQVFRDFSEGKIDSQTMGGLISSFSKGQNSTVKGQEKQIKLWEKQRASLEEAAKSLAEQFKFVFDGEYPNFSDLLGDMDFSVADKDIDLLKAFSSQLDTFVLDVEKSINALSKTNGGISGFFNNVEEGIFAGTNHKSLDSFRKQLNKKIAGYLQNGETGVADSSKKIEIGVQLADNGDVTKLKEKLTEGIIKPLQAEASKNKVEIPIVYKVQDENGKPISSKEALEKSNLKLQADVTAIQESIKVAIDSINADLQGATAPKLKIGAVIDEKSIKDSVSDNPNIPIGSVKADLSDISGALNIKTDGLATEATLSSILNAVQTIGKKAFGEQWGATDKVKSPALEEQRSYVNYHKLLDYTMPTQALTADARSRLSTINKARLFAAMGNQQENDIKSIWKAIKGSENYSDVLEKLKETKYYSSVTKRVLDDGSVQTLADYGSGTINHENQFIGNWQSNLEYFTKRIFDKYQRDMGTLGAMKNNLENGGTITLGKTNLEQVLDGNKQDWRTIVEKGFGKVLTVDANTPTNVNWKDIVIAQLRADQEYSSKAGRKKFLSSRQHIVDEVYNSGNYKTRESAENSVIASYYNDQINGVKRAFSMSETQKELFEKAYKRIIGGTENAIYRMEFSKDKEISKNIRSELGLDDVDMPSLYARENRGKLQKKGALNVLHPGDVASKRGEDTNNNQNWLDAMLVTDPKKNGGKNDVFLARKHTALNSSEAERAILEILAPLQEETQEAISTGRAENDILEQQVKIRKRLVELRDNGQQDSAEYQTLKEQVVLDREELRTKTNIEGIEKRIQRLNDKKRLQPKDFSEDDETELGILEKNLESARKYPLLNASMASNKLTSSLGITVGDTNKLANFYVRNRLGEDFTTEENDEISSILNKVSSNKGTSQWVNQDVRKLLLSIGVNNLLDKNENSLSKINSEIDDLATRVNKAKDKKEQDALDLKIGEKIISRDSILQNSQRLMKEAVFSSDDKAFNYAMDTTFVEKAIDQNKANEKSIVKNYKQKAIARITGSSYKGSAPGVLLPYNDDDSYRKDLTRLQELKAENLYYYGLSSYENGYAPMRHGGYASRPGAYVSYAGSTKEEKRRLNANKREIKEIETRMAAYEAVKHMEDDNWAPADVLFKTEEERQEWFDKKKMTLHVPSNSSDSFDRIKDDYRVRDFQDLSNDIANYNLVSKIAKRGGNLSADDSALIARFEENYGNGSINPEVILKNAHADLENRRQRYIEELMPEIEAAAIEKVDDDAKYYHNAAEKDKKIINKNLSDSAMYGTGRYGALGKDHPLYRKDMRSYNETKKIEEQLGSDNAETIMSSAIKQRDAAQNEIENIKNSIIGDSSDSRLAISSLKEIQSAKKAQQTANEKYENSVSEMMNMLTARHGFEDFAEENKKFFTTVTGDVHFTPEAFLEESGFADSLSYFLDDDKSKYEIQKIFNSVINNKKKKTEADEKLDVAQKRGASLLKNFNGSSTDFNVDNDTLNRFMNALESKEDAEETIRTAQKNVNWKAYDESKKKEISARKLPIIQEQYNDFLATLSPDIADGIREAENALSLARKTKDKYGNQANKKEAVGYKEAERTESTNEARLRRMKSLLNDEDAQKFNNLHSWFVGLQSQSGFRTTLDADYEDVKKQTEISDIKKRITYTITDLRDNAGSAVLNIDEQLSEINAELDRVNGEYEKTPNKKTRTLLNTLNESKQSLLSKRDKTLNDYYGDIIDVESNFDKINQIDNLLKTETEGSDSYKGLVEKRKTIVTQTRDLLSKFYVGDSSVYNREIVDIESNSNKINQIDSFLKKEEKEGSIRIDNKTFTRKDEEKLTEIRDNLAAQNKKLIAKHAPKVSLQEKRSQLLQDLESIKDVPSQTTSGSDLQKFLDDREKEQQALIEKSPMTVRKSRARGYVQRLMSAIPLFHTVSGYGDSYFEDVDPELDKTLAGSNEIKRKQKEAEDKIGKNEYEIRDLNNRINKEVYEGNKDSDPYKSLIKQRDDLIAENNKLITEYHLDTLYGKTTVKTEEGLKRDGKSDLDRRKKDKYKDAQSRADYYSAQLEKYTKEKEDVQSLKAEIQSKKGNRASIEQSYLKYSEKWNPLISKYHQIFEEPVGIENDEDVESLITSILENNLFASTEEFSEDDNNRLLSAITKYKRGNKTATSSFLKDYTVSTELRKKKLLGSYYSDEWADKDLSLEDYYNIRKSSLSSTVESIKEKKNLLLGKLNKNSQAEDYITELEAKENELTESIAKTVVEKAKAEIDVIKDKLPKENESKPKEFYNGLIQEVDAIKDESVKGQDESTKEQIANMADRAKEAILDRQRLKRNTKKSNYDVWLEDFNKKTRRSSKAKKVQSDPYYAGWTRKDILRSVRRSKANVQLSDQEDKNELFTTYLNDFRDHETNYKSEIKKLTDKKTSLTDIIYDNGSTKTEIAVAKASLHNVQKRLDEIKTARKEIEDTKKELERYHGNSERIDELEEKQKDYNKEFDKLTKKKSSLIETIHHKAPTEEQKANARASLSEVEDSIDATQNAYNEYIENIKQQLLDSNSKLRQIFGDDLGYSAIAGLNNSDFYNIISNEGKNNKDKDFETFFEDFKKRHRDYEDLIGQKESLTKTINSEEATEEEKANAKASLNNVEKSLNDVTISYNEYIEGIKQRLLDGDSKLRQIFKNIAEGETGYDIVAKSLVERDNPALNSAIQGKDRNNKEIIEFLRRYLHSTEQSGVTPEYEGEGFNKKYKTHAVEYDSPSIIKEDEERRARIQAQGQAFFDLLDDKFNTAVQKMSAPTDKSQLTNHLYTQEEDDARRAYNKAWTDLRRAQGNGAAASVVQGLQEAVNKAKVEVEKFGTFAYTDSGYARLSDEVYHQRNNLPMHQFINSTIKNDDFIPKSHASMETPWVQGLATEDTLRQIYNAITDGNRILGTGEDRVITHEGDDARGRGGFSRKGKYSYNNSSENSYSKYNKKNADEIPDNAVYVDNAYGKKLPYFVDAKSTKKKRGKQKAATTIQDAVNLVTGLSDDDLAHLVNYGENGKQQSILKRYLEFLYNSKEQGIPSQDKLEKIGAKAGLKIGTKKNGEKYFYVAETRADSKKRTTSQQQQPTQPNNNSQPTTPTPQPTPQQQPQSKGKSVPQPQPTPQPTTPTPQPTPQQQPQSKGKSVPQPQPTPQPTTPTPQPTPQNNGSEKNKGKNTQHQQPQPTPTSTPAPQSKSKGKNKGKNTTQPTPQQQPQSNPTPTPQPTTPTPQPTPQQQPQSKGKGKNNSKNATQPQNNTAPSTVDNEKKIRRDYKKIVREMYGNDSILMRRAKGINLNADTSTEMGRVAQKLKDADKKLEDLVKVGVVSKEFADELTAYKKRMEELVNLKASDTKNVAQKQAIREMSKPKAYLGKAGKDRWDSLDAETQNKILERDHEDALADNMLFNQDRAAYEKKQLERQETLEKKQLATFKEQIQRRGTLFEKISETDVNGNVNPNYNNLTTAERIEFGDVDKIKPYLDILYEIKDALNDIDVEYEKLDDINFDFSSLTDSFDEVNNTFGGLKFITGKDGSKGIDVKKLKTYIEESQKSYTSAIQNDLQKKINDADLSGYTEGAKELYTEKLNEYNAFRDKYKDVDLTSLKDDDLMSYNAQLKEYKSSLEGILSSQNKVVDTPTLSKMSSNFEQWLSKNNKVFIKYKDQIEEFRKALSNTTQSNYNADQLNGAIETFKSNVAQAGDLGESFFGEVSSRFKNLAVYLSSFVQFYDIIRYFKEGIQYVKEYDSAMIDLRKVVDGTNEQIESFGKNSFEIADEIGSTSTAIIQAGTEWARLGKDIDSVSSLAKASTIYANVGEIDATTATQDLISAMNAFSIADEDAMSVVDKMNIVGNNYAVSSAQLGEILEKSSASLAVGGDDIDHVIAMGAAMNEVIQDSSIVGSTLKVVGLRLRGTKTEIEELGEETDGMAESTSKLRTDILALTNVDGKGGFDIMKNNKEYKTTYEIIKGIADVWDDMSQIDQSALLEEIAGKNRAQGAAALISNFDTAERALQDSLNSEGSAIKENDTYLEGISAHQAKLSNAWSELWVNAIDEDVIIFFTDLGTGILSIINNLGTLKTILVAVGTAITGIKPTLTGNGVFATAYGEGGYGKLLPEFNEANPIGKFLSDLKSGRETTQAPIFTANNVAEQWIKDYYDSQRNATTMDQFRHSLDVSARDDSSGLTENFVQFIRNLDGQGVHLDNVQDGMDRYRTYIQRTNQELNQFSVKTLAAKGATLALNTALGMLGSFLVTSVISGFIDLISYLATYNDKIAESASATADAYNETCNSIDEYADRINKNYDTISDSSSSVEDVANARLDLLNVQDELINKFGDESDAINIVTESLEKQKAAIDALKGKAWEDQLKQFKEDNDIKTDNWWSTAWNFVKEGAATLFSPGHKFNDSVSNVFNDLNSQKISIDSYSRVLRSHDGTVGFEKPTINTKTSEELQNTLINALGGKGNVSSDHNIYEIIDALNNQKQKNEQLLSGDTLTEANAAIDEQLDKYNEKLEKYGDFIEQYTLNEKILKEGSSIAKPYSNLTEAYNRYMDAYASGSNIDTNNALEGFSEAFEKMTEDNNYKTDAYVKHYVDNLYTGVQLEANKHKFQLGYEVDSDTNETISKAIADVEKLLSKQALNSEGNAQANVVTKNYISNLNKEKDAYKGLVEIANKYNLTLDELLDKLESMGTIKSANYQELLRNNVFTTEQLDKLNTDQINQIYNGTQSYKNFLGKGNNFDYVYGENSQLSDYQRDWMANSKTIGEAYDQVKASSRDASELSIMSKAMEEAGKSSETLRYRLSKTTESISSLTDGASALDTALTESRSSGEISSDTLSDLNSKIEDASELLILSSDGVKLNSDAMDKYIDKQAEDQTNELTRIYKGYTEQLATQKKQLESLEDASERLNSEHGEEGITLEWLSDGTKVTTENIESLTAAQNENIESTQKQMKAISLQMGKLKELTSVYNKYIKATGTKNQGDRFDTVTSAYDATKKLYDNGQYYTDDVMQFIKLFGNPDTAKGLSQYSSRADMQTEAKKALANYKKYMTDDEDGPTAAYKNLWNAIEKNNGTINGASFIKDDATGSITGINIQDFDKAASSIGLTGDALEVLLEKLREYQGNDIFAYTGIDRSADEIVKDITATNQAITENTKDLKDNTSAKQENEQKVQELKDTISSSTKEALEAKKQAAEEEATKQITESSNSDLETLLNYKVEFGVEFNQEEYDAVLQKAIDLKAKMESAMKSGDDSGEITFSNQLNEFFNSEEFKKVFGNNADSVRNMILTADVSGFLNETGTVVEEQEKIETWFDKDFSIKVNSLGAITNLHNVDTQYSTLKDRIEKNPITAKIIVSKTETPFNITSSTTGTSTKDVHSNGGRTTAEVDGGIARADGTLNTFSSGNTLVGELGQELVVDRSTGTWRTVGDNGAEFADIDKGDIVFNANQTKALLSSGHINGRGKALYDGQHNESISVSASGIAGVFDSTGKPSTNKTKKKSTASDKTTKANTEATEKNTEATEDETKQTYNWIEVLSDNIEHLRDLTSESGTSEWNSYSTRISAYRQMIEYDKQEYETWTAAVGHYGTELNEKLEAVRQAFGDDTEKAEAYISLIKNGSLGDDWKTELIQPNSSKSSSSSSSSSDDPLVKAYNKQVDAISEAQTWVENLQTAESNQVKWLKQQHEDLKSIYDLQLEQNKAIISTIDSEISEMQAQIEMKDTVGDIVTTGDYEDLIDATDDKISQYYNQIEILQNELAELGDDMDSAEYQEIEASIADCNAQILECEKSQAEWNETIKQLPIDHIENYIANIKTAQSDLSDYIAELNAAGKKITADVIKQQVEIEQLIAKQYQNELAKVEKNLNTYTVGSDKWNTAFQNLQQLDDEISNIVQDMIGFNKQLLAMPVDNLADVADEISSINEGLTALQDDNLTVINAAIDTITRNAEELTKPLQKQLDLLQKTSDQRKRQLDIEQAAWELEKAKQNKTVQVVRNGKLVYEADQDNVRTAQDSYQQALDSEKQSQLSDEIDRINDEADDLKEKWEKIQSDSEYQVSVEEAAKLAGMSVDEFRNRVLSGNDVDLYNKTKDSYETTDKQQAAVEHISDTLSTIQTLIEEVNTKYLAGQLTADQAKAMVQQLINASKDGLTGQEELDNRLNIEQQESVDSAVQDAKDNIAKTTEEYNKVVQQTVDNTSIIAEYQKKEAELTEEIKQQLEKANEAYQNTLKAEKTSGSYSSRSDRSSSSSSSSSSSGVTGGILFSSDAERDAYNSRWGTSHNSSDSTVSSYSGPTAGTTSSDRDKDKNTTGNGKSHVVASGYKFANGIANGAISGVGSTNSDSEKFRLLQQMALDGFKPSEVPVIADIGEAILNPTQQGNILKAMNQSAVTGMVAGATMRSMSPVVNVNLGDMTLPNVTNGSEFAKTLTQTIEPTMNQYFSKFFK